MVNFMYILLQLQKLKNNKKDHHNNNKNRFLFKPSLLHLAGKAKEPSLFVNSPWSFENQSLLKICV